MFKRPNYPQEGGDRKKPKLDFSVSDHNFPLSQNASANKAPNHNDNWDDDIDDEILLQASQACEEACNSSVLPEYSQFRPPVLTSTQKMYEPVPGPSRGTFTFKKPNTGGTNTVTTLLKDKCDRILTPLRGLSTKVTNTEKDDLGDNAFSDKVLNSQDTNCIYRQLLKVKEENEKLKCEHSKLQERCVTKEGEASILRTQLKSYQVAVDNARLDKLKTQEQAQIQWSEKLNALKNQLHEVQTQLDFKNLEIINMKEKCKMLESNKVKLTQVTVAGNDLSRLNNNTATPLNSVSASQLRRKKAVSSSVQTDCSPQFFKLSKACRRKQGKLIEILPLVMNSTTDHQHSLLEYNEKLKKPADLSPNKCRIFNTYHRLSSSSDSNNVGSKQKIKINISCIYEDLTSIAACDCDVEKTPQHYVNIFKTTRTLLEDVQCQLETVSKRLTLAFEKEVNKKYIESCAEFIVVDQKDLLLGKAIFKEEQAILARRMTAVLQSILDDSKAVNVFLKTHSSTASSDLRGKNEFIELLCKICTFLDDNSCGIFYSGLQLSIILLIEKLAKHSKLDSSQLLDIMKHMVSSRGLLFVPCRLLRAVAAYYRLLREDSSVKALCSQSNGNVKEDYEQGVLLFKKETCILQILLKQVEASLKCMERQKLSQQIVDVTRDLLQFHSSFTTSQRNEQVKSRCDCDCVLLQIITYSLRICSSLLDSDRSRNRDENDPLSAQQLEVLGVCRSGLQALHQSSLKDVEFTSQLGYYEGHLIEFCERLRAFKHNEFYRTMLSEIMSMFQAVGEECSPLHREVWLRSFETFSLLD